VRPRIGRYRTPSDDTFGLWDIDRVQQEARCSNVGHGGSESAPVAERPGCGHDRGAGDGIKRTPEKTITFGVAGASFQTIGRIRVPPRRSSTRRGSVVVGVVDTSELPVNDGRVHHRRLQEMQSSRSTKPVRPSCVF
jgi:hypothetical protein